MNSTPLPLWVVPAKDEPAHGILMRLAERNGIQASGRVPALTGLKISRLRKGHDVERLAAIIRCDVATLKESTCVVTQGELEIRGERVGSKRELKHSIRRLCPQCVAESAHHRFWYDLEFISTCPEHFRNLVNVCSCGHDLSWSDVRIGKCRHCEDGNVNLLPETFANRDVIATDRWALGRLGVGAVDSFPLLDTMPLDFALHMIGQIGALDIGGYQEFYTEPRNLDVPAAEVRARGFQILKNRQLDAVLDKVYEEFRSSPRFGLQTIDSAYGWFGGWFRLLRPESFAAHIAEIVLANASRKFQIRQRELRGIPRVQHLRPSPP